jgi:predicted nucleic-acid-binding protein
LESLLWILYKWIFTKKKFNSDEKKYTVLNTILNENNIDILFGDDGNYFEILDNWINSSL